MTTAWLMPSRVLSIVIDNPDSLSTTARIIEQLVDVPLCCLPGGAAHLYVSLT